jgi:CRISPR-associated protein Cas5 subtype I-B
MYTLISGKECENISNLNLVRLKKNEYPARVNLELIINPKYRIYFSDSKLSEKLENYLQNHQTKFTPYLGTSSMIANFGYINTFDYYVQRKKTTEISSIMPYISNIPNVVIERDKFYAMEQSIPARINENRELVSTYSAIYNPNGQSIKIRDIEEVNTFQYEGREHNFVFLPT